LSIFMKLGNAIAVKMKLTEKPQHARKPLAFSIDFEGYVESMEESFSIPASYPRYQIEYEIRANCDRCLKILADFNIKGTFFVLGWIVEQFPQILTSISAENHEIGSHSMYHKRLHALEQDLIRDYISKSKKLLEDVTGARVYGFRAPDFSLCEDSWIMDFLREMGFAYDSSINPTNIHDVYGGSSANTRPYQIENGLIEFPMPTTTFFKKIRLSVGGGGYFRVFPFWLTKRWLDCSESPITYLHPYEIGGVYPREIQMPLLRKLRHNYMNGRLDKKLRLLFETYNVMPAIDYLRMHYEIN